jgi:hypothetical protein
MLSGSVSPDGTRLAYVAGEYSWDVLEVSLADRTTRALVAGGGIAVWPDWAPSGTHFLFNSTWSIVDQSAKDGFTRQLIQAGSEYDVGSAQWASDGLRFSFFGPEEKLVLSNASGGRTAVLDSGVRFGLAGWSPDGQWIAYARRSGGEDQLAKMRPGSGEASLILTHGPTHTHAIDRYPRLQWSPSGEWILYPNFGENGLSLISPDGSMGRKLTSREFSTYGFSKDGRQVLGIYWNPNPAGTEWQMYAVDVKSGAEKLLGGIDLPPATEAMAGFSMHPDGKSFLTSIAKWPFDIWMMEGFDQHKG